MTLFCRQNRIINIVLSAKQGLIIKLSHTAKSNVLQYYYFKIIQKAIYLRFL